MLNIYCDYFQQLWNVLLKNLILQFENLCVLELLNHFYLHDIT